MDIGRRKLVALSDVTSTADKNDRTEGLSESMRHTFEDVRNGAESSRDRKEPNASMEH